MGKQNVTLKTWSIFLTGSIARFQSCLAKSDEQRQGITDRQFLTSSRSLHFQV